LAIFWLKFEGIVDGFPPELTEECENLKGALHSKSDEVERLYDCLEARYTNSIQPLEEPHVAGDLAQFLDGYLRQVESLLLFIKACRSADWMLYLAALEDLIKYFFAHDLLNNARLMPVHLAQMFALEQEDPATWNALKSGDFVVRKSGVPFTCLYTDQALEQQIKLLKKHGGMIGLSTDEGALQRLIAIAPRLKNMVHTFMSSLAGIVPAHSVIITNFAELCACDCRIMHAA
jgi:hypothetical protein